MMCRPGFLPSRSHALTLLFLALAWAAPAFGQAGGEGLRFELDAARRERLYATNSARRSAAAALSSATAELKKLARAEGRVFNLAEEDESPIYRDRRLAAHGIKVPEGTPTPVAGTTTKVGPVPLSPVTRVSLEQRLQRDARLEAQARGIEAQGRGERYAKQLSWAQSWSKDAEEQRAGSDRRLREEIAHSVMNLADQMDREAGGKPAK
jgi:hypothetical protein